MYKVSQIKSNYKVQWFPNYDLRGQTDHQEVQEFLNKPNKYINRWVTTIICGCGNRFLAKPGVGRCMHRAGRRRDSQLKQTSPLYRMIAWQKLKRDIARIGSTSISDILTRLSQNNIPQSPYQTFSTAKLLKTYLVIHTDTKKSEQIINCLNYVLWRGIKKKKKNIFPSAYFWQSNQLTKYFC